MMKQFLSLGEAVHALCQYLLRRLLQTALLLALCSTVFGATFTVAQEYGNDQSSSLVVADLNGDGKLDFIVGGASTVMVYLGTGDGTFTLKAQYSSADGSYPSYPHIGDLNGDG